MHFWLITIGIVLIAAAGLIFGSPPMPERGVNFWGLPRFFDTATASWKYPAMLALLGAVLIALALTV